MKKILFRKLLLDYLKFFIISLFSASIIIWVFQAVNFLDIMIEDGRDYTVYIKYSLLSLPKIINKIYPFALFFSLFYVTTKYETNNELIIFWNFGVHKIELINFIMKISLIFMVVQILLASLIVPSTQDIARSFLRSSSVNFFGNFIKPQRFNDTIKNVTIYSEKKDSDGNLFNLYLKKETDINNFQITYAKKGFFKEINKFPILVLFDGQTITVKDGQTTNIGFTKSDFPLKNIETNTMTYTKTQELSTKNLFLCIEIIQKTKSDIIKTNIENCSKQNLNNIYKEFYKRLIVPLYIPLLTLVPLLLIISSKESSNYNKIKLLTFLIGLFSIIFSETTIRFVSEIFLFNFTISIIPIIIFLFLYLFFLKNFSIRKFN
ncbi:LptF/LptG family permease [Candidatus Pelagibacter sp. FZCC0015]|uniref:LptF/LptG family permease n=1 Tax=Candidatus Pelagibacter sp. FZCC0015 TaxID=2268451 RepID=UPI0011A58EAB|nr:LptF/LptG family permease [Candidatus Pelagibacter sp. FZCC0015]